MCPSVPSSLPSISLSGFLANLDPYPSPLNIDSPAPDNSDVSAYSVLSPVALAFDSSTSEVTWLGVPVGRLRLTGCLYVNSDCEIGILNTLLPFFTNRTRSIVDPAVITGAFT
ncbi:hypothetical protein N7537_011274 [Penicillium hordei]|uniref:Uncharacterized protein n=1 Tax=Penicillium hordei TaxID=40994 RepID=A0AAD6DLJ2_9EURO|nr:uncharacterized protein N7537_011274 [Penicillium hordei]KAJ5588596.1 hypothetical protein N7537_011274 [Penicillium hordei]